MQYYYHPKNNEFNTIKEIMDTWLKEEYYPIVYVERDFDNNAAICYVSSVTFNTKWKIPITYATQSTNESQETLNVTWINWQQGITIPNIKRTDLLIVNLQQIGTCGLINLLYFLIILKQILMFFMNLLISKFYKNPIQCKVIKLTIHATHTHTHIYVR